MRVLFAAVLFASVGPIRGCVAGPELNDTQPPVIGSFGDTGEGEPDVIAIMICETYPDGVIICVDYGPLGMDDAVDAVVSGFIEGVVPAPNQCMDFAVFGLEGNPEYGVYYNFAEDAGCPLVCHW